MVPGYQESPIWRFNRAWQVSFAYLIPGHMEVDMRGTVYVSP